MEKIWAPADKVLCEIGRFVLIRPRITGILLITAVIITLFSNNLWNAGNSAVDSIAENSSPKVMNLAIADDSDVLQSPTLDLSLPAASPINHTEQSTSTAVVPSNASATPVAANSSAQRPV